MSDTSKVKILVSPETAWGETPDSPEMTELLINSEGIASGKETAKSTAIRSDRQKTSILKTGESANGNLSLNLSEGALDLFGAGIMQAAKVENSIGSGGDAFAGTVDLVAASDTIVFSPDTDYSKVKGANVVLIAGSATPANDGRKVVLSRDDATPIRSPCKLDSSILMTPRLQVPWLFPATFSIRCP